MQVPPPPQAEGKKTFCDPKVVNNVEPEATSIFFSPLIVRVTGPDGESFSLVNNNNVTNNNKRIRNATTVISIVPPVLVAKIIFTFL